MASSSASGTHGMTMRQRNSKPVEPQPSLQNDATSNSNQGKSGRGRGRKNAVDSLNKIPQAKKSSPKEVVPPGKTTKNKENQKPPPKKVTNSKNRGGVPVISSSVKLRLGSAPAAFGDVEDIFKDKVIKSDGGTIHYNIDVRRKFMPGNYILHIVKTPTSSPQYYDSQYGVILCREDVDPVKIHDLLKESTYGTWDFRLSNGISRYDWKHFRNWGSFKHEEEEMEKYNKRMENRRRRAEENGEYDYNGRQCRNPEEALKCIAELMRTARYGGYNPWDKDSPPSSPEPEEPPQPVKTPEEIAHDTILSTFKNILLNYFTKKKAKIVKQCTLFVDSGRIREIGQGKFTITQDNAWVYIIRPESKDIEEKFDEAVGGVADIDDDDILGFLIIERPNKGKTLIAGDWHYGCVLQDEGSKEYFGFVFGDCFENEERNRAPNPNDIAAKNYVWDVNQLLLS